MRMQRAPLLLLSAIPRVDADTEGCSGTAPQKLSLLGMVSTFKTEGCCHRILLDICSAIAGGAQREEVFEELLVAWRRAGTPASMGKELRRVIVLSHGDHGRGQAKLVVRGDRHEVLLLPVEPTCALRNVAWNYATGDLSMPIEGQRKRHLQND